MPRTPRRWFALSSVGVSLLLVSAACGDSKTETADTSTTTAAVASTTSAKPLKKLRVAVVSPSAENDLAFTQSMMDAVKLVANERGPEGMSYELTPQMFDLEKARAAMESYASDGVDVIIAHGSQYGPLVEELAKANPTIAFAWGTASDTFGLPNVYAYTVAAEEGGEVLGTVAAELTKTDNIGVIGPVEVGDAKQYIEGFVKGVSETKPSVATSVTYIGSFSDVVKAGEVAKAFTDGGADVLTGTSQAMSGAVPVAVGAKAAWFGNQSSNVTLSPEAVVASQVYHFEDTLRDIMSNTERGTLGGVSYNLNLANDGLVIEYNPDFKLSKDARAKGDAVEARISAAAPKPGA